MDVKRYSLVCIILVGMMAGVACSSESASTPETGVGPEYEIVWTEESAEPVAVQVHRDVRAGNAPAEFTTEIGVRYVRRDLAVELPDFEEEGTGRTLEQIAEDERYVLQMSDVEYISDPDLVAARSILDGEQGPPMESTPSDGAGAEGAEELRERFDFGTLYPLASVAHLYPDHTQVWQVGAGSATQVGQFTLVTAAHTIHTGNSFKTCPTLVWGGNGAIGQYWFQQPCGSNCACWMRSVKSGWDGGADNVTYDYAVYDLRGCVQNAAGWLGLSTAMGWDVTHYLNGYPVPPPSGPSGGLWGSNGEVFSHSTLYPDRVYYRDLSTLGGHSGAGVYRKTSSGSRFVTGIHVAEQFHPLWNAVNLGRRMDSNIINFLKAHGLCKTPGFEVCN